MHSCSYYKGCHGGVIGWISLILVIIGGLNWGLIGLFSYNLVAALVGAWPVAERIIYILVGLGSLFMIYKVICCCSSCKECSCGKNFCNENNASNKNPSNPQGPTL